MPTIDIFNTDREKVGSVELSDKVFGTDVKEHLFHAVVRYQLAKRRAGTHKAKGRTEENKVTVFDQVAFEQIKTRQVSDMLKRFEMSDLLLVLSEKDDTVMRSARNIPGVTVMPVAGLNVYDVLRHSNIAFTRAAVDLVVDRLGG